MEYAPIILFTYCRPVHTRKTVEALLANEEAKYTDLYIYSDAAKNEKAEEGVKLTREYIHTITGFKSIVIVEREKNWGLAPSLIDGITKVINERKRAIIVEDDIWTSPYFLKYMNDGLNIYANNPKVASIVGYTYPIKEKLPETFFIKGTGCWGWATWERAWKVFNSDAEYLLTEIKRRRLQRKFDFDYTYPYVNMLQQQIKGKISSWAIRWYASAFLKDMYSLFPGQSMVFQGGMDGDGGTHCNAETHLYDVKVRMTPVNIVPQTTIEQSEDAYQAIREYLSGLLSRRFRMKWFIKRLFNLS